MLAANIKKILEKKGKKGWLRVSECAKEYAKDKITREINESEKTKFYHWRKQVEKGKVSGFQVKKYAGNISYIGLQNADPTAIFKVKTDVRYKKRLEAIKKENLSNPILTYPDLLLFMDTLPSNIKEKVWPEVLMANAIITKARQWRLYEEPAQRQERLKTVISLLVFYFINEITTLLNGEFERLHRDEKNLITQPVE